MNSFIDYVSIPYYFWKLILFVRVVLVIFLKLKNFESYLCKYPVKYLVVKQGL
jgi:hypothetical protein